MLKFGRTLPNIASICLHKSTTAKIYPFTEIDKDYLEKIREHVVCRTSFVFARKAVVDETFIRYLTNRCNFKIGSDASQLYFFSICPTKLSGLYTRWELDSESGKTKPRQNKTRSFENRVMSYFQRVRPQFKVESFYATGTQKNWCIQSWWLSWTLQHCVWGYGVLLSLLPMTRSSAFSHWGGNLARH